ncbi:MAG TPA: hypothetical protein VMU43_04980 [Candidatus Acidoferrum sp.]|nr:hypothetical protein [Candidatus Acidoferrum sp.]
MDKDSLEGLISLLDNWAVFFTLLVVIGVGGELVIHIMSSRANKKLITLQKSESLAQEAEIARMKKDSASFELDIAKANKGAAEALERAAKAEENLASAKKSAAEANEKAGAFQLQIAQANERTAKAELELAKIKAPRVLTEAQQRELVDVLKPFPNTVISIEFAYADGEAKAFAMQLFGVLRKAGWKADPKPSLPGGLAGDSMDAANTLGVVVSTFGQLTRGGVPIALPRFAEAGTVLSKTLDKMGFLSKYPGIKKVSDNPDEALIMVVGRKPLE